MCGVKLVLFLASRWGNFPEQERRFGLTPSSLLFLKGPVADPSNSSVVINGEFNGTVTAGVATSRKAVPLLLLQSRPLHERKERVIPFYLES